MSSQATGTRRDLLKAAAWGTVAAGLGAHGGRAARADSTVGQRIPLKIAVRAVSLKMVGDINVIKTAARIPGIRGVELQTTAGTPNLCDEETVRRYKRQADRWAMRIASLAGVFDRGVTIRDPAAAENLIRAIRAAAMLGASTIVVAFFRSDAPDMTHKESYGPIVTMLQKTAKHAANVGVMMGLENSLSPAENKNLVDLVDHPAVGVCYDLHNMAHYGYRDQAIPGIKLLGKKRICEVHVKNGARLLEEPGPIDWAAAFRALGDIRYDGWYVYETSHESTADCIEDTKKNNVFLRKHVRMPVG